jgi:hypothetical protein
LFGASDALEKVQDLLWAENDGQFLGLLGCWDDLIERPLPFQRDFVEKAQSGDRDENGASGQFLFVSEVDLIGADLLGP